MAESAEQRTNRAGPSEDLGENTRERLLDVAERLFAARGLAGTSVRDIAAEAGLTAASLYNHFDGKQALYDAVLARGVQPLFDLFDASGAPPANVLDRIVDHFAARPDIARLIQHESLTGNENLSRAVHGWLRPIVENGLQALERNSDSVWSEEERPLAIAAWIHVILGHFAQAPLLAALLDFDPLSPEQLERQKRFLRHFSRLMTGGD